MSGLTNSEWIKFRTCEKLRRLINPKNRSRRRNSCAPTEEIMEDSVVKSCWGVTFKALCGFAGILAIAYLVGSF